MVFFGCFLFCAVTAENDAISLSLSLFFREEYVCARTRILSEKKGGNRLKRKNLIKEILERREAQMILPMNKQVYILLSLPTKKSPESSFKKKKEKTREVEGRGSEAGFGSMFNKVWEGANRRDAIMRTTRQDMFLGRFNQFIIKIKRCFIGRVMRLPAHKWSFFRLELEREYQRNKENKRIRIQKRGLE